MNNFYYIALGSFDGLHLGHMAVINNTIRQAERLSVLPAVLLFDRHPLSVLKGKAPGSLMTDEDKKRSFEKKGVTCFTEKFAEIRDMSPEEFFEKILLEKYSAAGVCCGYNYTFGKKGSGNTETLKALCEKHGLDLVITDKVIYNGEGISSGRIRKAVQAGDMVSAAAMLGRPFSYRFEVVDGDHLGRKLGSPTINQLFPKGFTVPLYGVYTSETVIDGEKYRSVTNIGVRPTVNGSQERSETYIIDYSGDLYGKNIRVSLLKYLRSEKKFGSLDELKAQIKFDADIVTGSFKPKKLSPKAVFFDFDDTLQSREGAYRLYCEYFIKKYFPGADDKEIDRRARDMEKLVDGGYKDREVYFPELIDYWQWKNPPSLEELTASFNEEYGLFVVMLPGAIDTLKALKKRGYVLGIISNGVSVLQNMKIDTAGIRDMFDVVVVSGDYGWYKPDRRLFDEACRQAGFKNADCLFVGDHPVNDIQGALGADMPAVRMNQGDFYNKEIDLHIPTIEKITDLLDLLD